MKSDKPTCASATLRQPSKICSLRVQGLGLRFVFKAPWNHIDLAKPCALVWVQGLGVLGCGLRVRVAGLGLKVEASGFARRPLRRSCAHEASAEGTLNPKP